MQISADLEADIVEAALKAGPSEFLALSVQRRSQYVTRGTETEEEKSHVY